MTEKRVKVKVLPDPDMSKVETLEKKINELRNQKIQLQINAYSKELDETKAKIESLKQQKATLEVGADDSKIDEISAEIAQLEEKAIDLQLAIDTSELQRARAEIEELDGQQINIDANMSMQNISQGLAQAKQGVQELYNNVQEVQQAGMQSEQNLGFLELNLGAEKARDTIQQINDIVAKMPGDDNTMRSVLSTAQALGNNLNPSEMEAAVTTMADYMQGSATMGKQALESQQDIMKYLLDGNTAELERGSIVSSQVDKLKEAKTFQERQAAMQQVLNDLGYGGIANLDTMVNKQAEWEGMLYNSRDALSSMWLDAERGAMDYILRLNDATNGILGMGIVAGQMVTGPLVDIMSGIGQVGVGLKTLKEASDFTGLTSKLGAVKTALLDVAGAAKNAGLWLLDAGKKALVGGANAVKSAAMWLVEKGAKAASTIASYALAAAQAVLNFVMSMNPIMLVVLAIAALVAALIWAYYNVDWFREMVDSAWQSLVQLGQYLYTVIVEGINAFGAALTYVGQLIYSTVVAAITAFMTYLTQLWTTIVSTAAAIWTTVTTTVAQIWASIVAFFAFWATLPGKVIAVLTSIISRVISFAGQLASNMMSAASNAVSNFASGISGLAGKLKAELDGMISDALNFAGRIGEIMWQAATNAWQNFLNGLDTHSPGIMQRTLLWEVSEMGRRVPIEGRELTKNLGALAKDAVSSFGKPEMNLDFGEMKGEFANGSIQRLADNQGNTQEINIIINGDIDNEDRLQYFVDRIRSEMNWNNRTAGRSV